MLYYKKLTLCRQPHRLTGINTAVAGESKFYDLNGRMNEIFLLIM